MAKEKEEKEEKEQKDTTKTKKKFGGELSLPLILGIVGGSIVIFMLFIWFLVLPYLINTLGGGKNHQAQTNEQLQKSENQEKKNKEEKEKNDEKNMQFGETGRITTNPKGSDRFIIINLGLEFKASGEEKGGEVEKKGEGVLPPKIMARLKGVVNSTVGNLTVEELQNRRDSLAIWLKAKMVPTFTENKMYLKDVILQEFIIQ